MTFLRKENESFAKALLSKEFIYNQRVMTLQDFALCCSIEIFTKILLGMYVVKNILSGGTDNRFVLEGGPI